MFLDFSAARDFFFDPRRSNRDCKTVPRRNSFGGRREPSESQRQIWISSRLDYDEKNSRQPTIRTGLDHEEIAELPLREDVRCCLQTGASKMRG
jgi:hypothetical protein